MVAHLLAVPLVLFITVQKISSQPCNGGRCGENAVYCFDETLEQWECQCVRGYQSITANPINCTDINECAEGNVHNCGNYTRCNNAIGYYTCECLPGFGRLRAVSGRWECTDFNECGSWPRNNCGNGTVCVNTVGGYTCACLDGYANPRLSYGQTICTDIDECGADSHNCGDGTFCQNLPGSYRCNCVPGYRRVDFSRAQSICTDVDECASRPFEQCGENSICINTPGSYSCVCAEGYVSRYTTGKNCSKAVSGGGIVSNSDRSGTLEAPRAGDAGTNRPVNPNSLGENTGGDVYVGVGVGIGVAFVVVAIFFMVAYIAGTERKKGKRHIQHDIQSYQADPKNQFVDSDSPVYEDIGPPLTSITPAIELPPVRTIPFKSATVGHKQAFRTISESVDTKSINNWRLVHNEINEALYAAADVDEEPIYCNTMERAKRQRPRLEPMAEELYYSPVYQSTIDAPTQPKKIKPPVAPKKPHLGDIHSPKRHVIRRNRQRLWISRVHSDGDAAVVNKTGRVDNAAQPNHPAFRRLVSEGDGHGQSQNHSHDIMEGTILRCGDKYYILEPQEKDENGKPVLFGLAKQHADEAL